MTEAPPKLRTMKCELAVLGKADGSCKFSQGRTALWASASGPGDVHISRRENDKMHIDVSYRQACGDCQHHKLNRLLESVLQNIVMVNHFPRTCLTVTVHCLQSDGSHNAAAITAASLAVLDNGIPCRAPCCGVQIVRVNGKLVVDPDAKTEQLADGFFLFVFERDAENVNPILLSSECTGPISITEISSAISLGKEAAKEIFTFFQETIQKKLSVDVLRS